jgi:triosephosphate isomerase
MQNIVAGNWKMNLEFNEAHTLLQGIIDKATNVEDVHLIICPPFPFLESFAKILEKKTNISIGSQNCSHHSKGAYTGDVSAEMLSSVGCQYVIVGHSERRSIYKESDEWISQKIEQCWNNKLIPILCCGEQLLDRKNENHFKVVEGQLKSSIGSYSPKQIHDHGLVLAYEPVWAIGTGETATPDQAGEMHQFIRSYLNKLLGSSENVPILYGGSCKPNNAEDLFKKEHINGGLIGGASLKAEDFIEIAQSF